MQNLSQTVVTHWSHAKEFSANWAPNLPHAVTCRRIAKLSSRTLCIAMPSSTVISFIFPMPTIATSRLHLHRFFLNIIMATSFLGLLLARSCRSRWPVFGWLVCGVVYVLPTVWPDVSMMGVYNLRRVSFGVSGLVWVVFHRPWPFLLISLSNNDNSSTAQWLPLF